MLCQEPYQRLPLQILATMWWCLTSPSGASHLPHGLGDLWDSWQICNPATVMTLVITSEEYMLKDKARAIIKMPLFLLQPLLTQWLLNNNISQMWMQNQYVNSSKLSLGLQMKRLLLVYNHHLSSPFCQSTSKPWLVSGTAFISHLQHCLSLFHINNGNRECQISIAVVKVPRRLVPSMCFTPPTPRHSSV